MKSEDLKTLNSALGDEVIREHAPIEVDGLRLRHTLAPASGESLAAVLRLLHERRLAALIRGGGSRLALGNPPRHADLVLSTERCSGIDELDAEEGVAQVRAGTRLASLREEARKAGWEPPLDPPGEATSVGGALAAAALGPRCLGYRRPRDCVLGLEVVLASGERTRCGGRVVKNVTGYDLQKLYVGSLGTLALIEGVWLRLRPRPERVVVLTAELSGEADPLAQGLEAAHAPGARAVALLDASLAGGLLPTGSTAEAPLLVVELAGDAAEVAASREQLADRIGAAEAPASALDRVREIQGEAPGPGAMRVRLDVLVARLAEAAHALRRAGAQLLVYPGVGLLYGRFPAEPDATRTGSALDAVRRAARSGGGGWRIEEAPLAIKQQVDVFGDPPETLGIMRALKAQYDPHGVLNPGRFLGGL